MWWGSTLPGPRSVRWWVIIRWRPRLTLRARRLMSGPVLLSEGTVREDPICVEALGTRVGGLIHVMERSRPDFSLRSLGHGTRKGQVGT